MMATSRIAHAIWLASVIRAVTSTTAIIGLPTILTRRRRQICMSVPGTSNWKKRFGVSGREDSLDGGTDYAFGGATTKNGTQDRTIINNPFPFGGGDFTITIDNMGKQINDYLASHAADPNALYILWGGGNDLFDDFSAQNVTNTATRVGMLI